MTKLSETNHAGYFSPQLNSVNTEGLLCAISIPPFMLPQGPSLHTQVATFSEYLYKVKSEEKCSVIFLARIVCPPPETQFSPHFLYYCGNKKAIPSRQSSQP